MRNCPAYMSQCGSCKGLGHYAKCCTDMTRSKARVNNDEVKSVEEVNSQAIGTTQMSHVATLPMDEDTEENTDDRYDPGNILKVNSVFINTRMIGEEPQEVKDDNFIEFRDDCPKWDCFICLTFSHAKKIKKLVDDASDDVKPKDAANLIQEFLIKKVKELEDLTALKITPKPDLVNDKVNTIQVNKVQVNPNPGEGMRINKIIHKPDHSFTNLDTEMTPPRATRIDTMEINHKPNKVMNSRRTSLDNTSAVGWDTKGGAARALEERAARSLAVEERAAKARDERAAQT